VACINYFEQGSGTGVTNGVMDHLKGTAQLKSLNLFATKVTDQGVEKLQQALPKCQICN